MTTLIRIQGTVVAVAGPERYYLAPHLAARPQGDSSRQLASLMCAYAHRVELAGTLEEYTDERAEAFARLVLDLARAESAT
jgi:hypothetical protein